MRLLIVEDEGITAMIARKSMQSLGYDVIDTVSNGHTAIQVALEKRPELILMDICLKNGIDGIDVASEILKTFKPCIIFVSAFSQQEIEQRSVSHAPLAYFEKPVDYNEIHKLIQSKRAQ